MPPLEVPELASGNPQLQKAINKITRAEQKALDRFDEKVTKVDHKLKIVKDVRNKFIEMKDAIVPFKTPMDFKELKGNSSDTSVLNVTGVDKSKAAPGSYEFEVLETASTNSVMTYGFPDRDSSQVGVGYISFKTPQGETREVYINSDNNTLDGVAATINQANMGVRATVVHDGTDSDEPWRLVISGDKTGWKEDFEWPQFYMLDGDLDLDLYRQREAKSAVIKFNGMPLMLDENKIKDLLPGVNIDIKKALPGQAIRVDISPDIEKIQEKAKNFVDKINAVLTVVNSQGQLDSRSRNDPAKALAADITLQNAKNQIRAIVQETRNEMDSNDIQLMRDIGLVFNRNGTIDFDAKLFQSKLESNFEEVATMFTGTAPLGGFANKLFTFADGMSRAGSGIMSMREKNLADEKERLSRTKESKEEKAAARLERAKMQFGRAEAAIQQMQQFQANAGGMLQQVGGG